MIGLSVSYTFHITMSLNFVVRTSGELENNVVAIERIEEYTNIATEVRGLKTLGCAACDANRFRSKRQARMTRSLSR